MLAFLKRLFRKRRQRRYVLRVNQEIPLDVLLLIVAKFTPIISKRDYDRLPPHVKAHFIPTRGK